MWLLLIEDEKHLGESLKRGLEEEGYTVDLARDGQEGEILARTNAYDALIVDWRLPRKDGRQVVENLRQEGMEYPILMLTALADIDHRVAGLDAGADDYLSKPFSFEELLARLRALLRRPPLSSQEHTLRLGGFEVDTVRHLARYEGSVVNLRPKEFQLLETFMRSPDAVLSRTVIAERVWGDPFYVSDNAIDVTISGLRQRMADAQDGRGAVRLETVRGVGYRLMHSE
jgi:DNA-binding response OmpR family regulator